jgi:hypothetical protein
MDIYVDPHLHSDYCLCNGDWSICGDNPENYPEYLKGHMETIGPFCDSDEDTDHNMERILTKLSPPPSPHRDNIDWFLIAQQDNIPLHIVSPKKKEVTAATKARKAAQKARETAAKAREVSRQVSAELKKTPMYY